jgi:cytochrome c peroxidase
MKAFTLISGLAICALSSACSVEQQSAPTDVGNDIAQSASPDHGGSGSNGSNGSGGPGPSGNGGPGPSGGGGGDEDGGGGGGGDDTPDDSTLEALLSQNGFTGGVQATLTTRLGHAINAQLADLGRQLWFDSILALNNDNSCSGCHSPTAGFGDTQSIAIGIGNNGIVGPDRAGPRNQRKAPMMANSAFFWALMLNGRDFAVSHNPFDNSQGFVVPAPEGTSLSSSPILLNAQAFLPPTERTESAGFGPTVPTTNDGIRAAVVARLNAAPGYVTLFGALFSAVASGGITYPMLASALAEFECSQTYATAPIDLYAQGNHSALTDSEKRGAALFFGKALCVSCHTVAGTSNEMFSDFQEHNIGVPQITPVNTNVTFDGPGVNEDFGLAQITGNTADRYKFRTSPIRNVAVQPAFFHDGAFTSLSAAIAHHLNPVASAMSFQPTQLPADLQGPRPSVSLVLANLDPIIQHMPQLTSSELSDLVSFVSGGLLDPRAQPANLRTLIPTSLPSGRAVLHFE